MEDVESQPSKLPYAFKKVMTKTSTKKRFSCLEVPLKDSQVCWAVGVKRELELVMKRPQDGKEEKWVVIWHSGCKKRRGDCILRGWQPFAMHYKLAPKDVLAFTILTPSLVSVLIVEKHRRSPPLLLGPPLSETSCIPQLQHRQHPPLEGPPLQLTNRTRACSPPLLIPEIKPLQCTPWALISRKALCYIKVKSNHLQGDSLLLDIPPEFTKQVDKLVDWGIEEVQHHSRSTLPVEKLVLDHEIEEGDLCVFELNVVSDAYTSCTLHVYVYKEDRGTPNIINIPLTKPTTMKSKRPSWGT